MRSGTDHARLLVVTLVLGIIAIPTIMLYVAGQEHNRINEIQANRIESCIRTYRAFPLMFEPFFPKNRKTWTPKQRHDWKQLQDRADLLASECGRQTKA